MALARRDDALHTYGDYLGWPDDVRYELIDGVAYLMSPAPDLIHQAIVGEIFRQVADALDGRPCRAFVSPVDVRIPRSDETDEEIDTVVQPDVLVVCEGEKLDRRGVRGGPDFVVEVLSPSTAAHDQSRKLRVYERAGVQEYWLVHPTDRVLIVYRRAGDEFGKPAISELEGVTEVCALAGTRIDWDAIIQRLPEISD